MLIFIQTSVQLYVCIITLKCDKTLSDIFSRRDNITEGYSRRLVTSRMFSTLLGASAGVLVRTWANGLARKRLLASK